MAILQNKFVREDGSIIGSSVIISCKYTSDVNSQTNLTVGDTTADEVEVECRVLAKEITAGEKLTYYQIEDGVENLIGIFYAEAPTIETKTSIRFKAYDGKAKLATDFSEWLKSNYEEFPKTLGEIVSAACDVAGVSLKSSAFQYSTLSIPAFYSDGITCRQIISWASQIAGCFVRCTTDGKISFSWYEKSNATISAKTSGTYQYFQDSLSKKTYTTDAIKRVQFKQSSDDIGVVYPEDSDGNCFSIASNSIVGLLDSDTQSEIAEYLYGKLKSITYTPLSFQTVRTASIKAGDIVSVTDGNGETVSTYVMKVYLDSSGTQISSTGDQNYADKAAVSSEQYKNMPVRMLELSKSIDGLNIRATSIETTVEENQKTTQEQIAEIDIRADGIESSVSAEIEGVKSELTDIRQSSEDVSIRIEKIETDGVDSVTTGTGYTFDSEGLHIQKDGEEVGNTIDHTGMYVKRSDEVILQANADGVVAVDLHAKNYLIVGDYSRFENYNNGSDSKRTGLFWIGGEDE